MDGSGLDDRCRLDRGHGRHSILPYTRCCPSARKLSTVEASLTEAPAPSLLHIEVKMALVGFIGTRSEHGAEDAAGVIVD
jgi:hypothetical protein